MSASNHTTRPWARIRKRLASDVSEILSRTLENSGRTANARAAVSSFAPKIARGVAAILTREIKQGRGLLDWSSWEGIVDEAVHDSFLEATGGDPSLDWVADWVFKRAMAERTGATLVSEGIPLAEPEWGTDEPSREWLARNVKKPARLAQMAEDILSGKVEDDGTVSEQLMHNPNLPFESARRLARARRFGSILCERPDATPEALAEWSEDLDPHTFEAVANHPNTNLETLKRMARSEDPSVADAALSTGRLPEEYFYDIVGPQSPERKSHSGSRDQGTWARKQGMLRKPRSGKLTKIVAADRRPRGRTRVRGRR